MHRPRPRRAAWSRREHGLWREGASGSLEMASLLDRFAGQNQGGILAAEAERIRHHSGDASVARLVGDHVERDRRVRNVVIYGRRNPLVLERPQRETIR